MIRAEARTYRPRVVMRRDAGNRSRFEVVVVDHPLAGRWVCGWVSRYEQPCGRKRWQAHQRGAKGRRRKGFVRRSDAAAWLVEQIVREGRR